MHLDFLCLCTVGRYCGIVVMWRKKCVCGALLAVISPFLLSLFTVFIGVMGPVPVFGAV